MMKAFVFPGQGSQFPGMAKDLYEASPLAKKMMDEADEILGFKLTEIMFNGSDEDLKATEVTQPAIFVHSAVKAACMAQEEGYEKPAMVAGHSLGEFSALVAAGALEFADALRLVAARANAMQKCCQAVPGGMAAIIGMPDAEVERICAQVEGVVIPANYNCDGQVVISGEKEAIAEACRLLTEAGAKRALPLNVSGAFHSPLMEPARAELADAIEKTTFHKPLCPIYQNVSAKAETEPEQIKKNLLAQLTSPVRWTQSVRAMMKGGAQEFVEIGPGNVLQGLIRRISA